MRERRGRQERGHVECQPMNSEARRSPGSWEGEPPEAPVDRRARHVRVAAGEAMVQQVQEQRQQDAHSASRPLARAHPPGAGRVGNQDKRGRHGPRGRSKR
jgi:hypothetical protein